MDKITIHTPTLKLFHNNPMMNRFTARVTKVSDDLVYLDQTCFYPESGGQAGDSGLIGNAIVTDTQYIDGDIAHIISGESSLKEGDEVECSLDWDRRYRIMRLHSAAHLMEYFLLEEFGLLERVGSFVNDKHDKSTYKYADRFLPERLKIVEDNINVFILEGHEIKRESDASDPDYRYWVCGKFKEPCGGTHPGNTSEIGEIKLKRKNPGSGSETVVTSLAD